MRCLMLLGGGVGLGHLRGGLRGSSIFCVVLFLALKIMLRRSDIKLLMCTFRYCSTTSEVLPMYYE